VTALILCCILCARRRRRKNTKNVESGWVPGEAPPMTGIRQPGEGSPRQSGEEHDTFLRQSRSATNGMQEANASARLVDAPSRPEAAARRDSDSDSEASSTSTYGRLIEPQGEAYSWGRDSLFGFPAPPPPPPQWPGPGYQPIMPVGELFRLVEEHEPSETESVHTGITRQSSLRPPPRLVDPERTTSSLAVPGVSVSSKHSASTQNSSRSRSRPPTTDPEAEEAEGEDVKFLTARRVQVCDLDLTPAKPMPSSSALDVAGSNWGRWSGITQFGRMSWLTKAFPYGSMAGRSHTPSSHGSANSKGSSKKSVGSSARSRRSNLSRTRPDSYQILEQGRNIYREVEEELSGMRRPENDSGVGFVVATGGRRPADASLSSKSEKSEKSEKSGDTVFYDAVSTLGPGTPLPVSRAVTPSLPVVRDMASEGRLAPPAYAEHVGPGENQDILDAPVPLPLSPFGTVSTSSTQARAAHPIPPGLALPNPAVWRRQSSSSIPSAGTEISGGPLPTPQIATGDILEEAPPNSDMHWRRLANSASSPSIALTYPTRTSVSLVRDL
jgi:hypothetical protein